ncbi:LppA family lipoprotein [Amycolatopsis panacis]|uniref:LppA family lipoprotein n=1 Tax=Amycolatopsis panacis TaxID=2340917 RepID=UPI001314329E|nr:LppA family lipoprotein [Amycolatopsis panacis]
MDQKTEQFHKLMKRPDIDQAMATYDEMYGKLRSQLTATVPSLKWRQTDDVSGSGCGNNFPAVNADLRTYDAVERGLPNWVAEGKIPDEQWEAAQKVADTLLRFYGFDSGPVVVKNQPSDHYVTFHAPDGSEVTFGTAVNTGLTVRIGCHLTADAKKRGTPAAPPTY